MDDFNCGRTSFDAMCHLFLSRRAAFGLQLWKNWTTSTVEELHCIPDNCHERVHTEVQHLGLTGQGGAPKWRLHWNEPKHKKVVCTNLLDVVVDEIRLEETRQKSKLDMGRISWKWPAKEKGERVKQYG
ncbi:uncharacterized protein LOC144213237 [Stigmatopora nigra]